MVFSSGEKNYLKKNSGHSNSPFTEVETYDTSNWDSTAWLFVFFFLIGTTSPSVLISLVCHKLIVQSQPPEQTYAHVKEERGGWKSKSLFQRSFRIYNTGNQETYCTMSPEVSAETLWTDALCPRKILNGLIFKWLFMGSSVLNFNNEKENETHEISQGNKGLCDTEYLIPITFHSLTVWSFEAVATVTFSPPAQTAKLKENQKKKKEKKRKKEEKKSL